MRQSENRDDFELKDEYDFSDGIRGRFYKPKKIPTTIRLDNDILLSYKKLSSEKKLPYQTIINLVLRDYLKNSNEIVI